MLSTIQLRVETNRTRSAGQALNIYSRGGNRTSDTTMLIEPTTSAQMNFPLPGPSMSLIQKTKDDVSDPRPGISWHIV